MGQYYKPKDRAGLIRWLKMYYMNRSKCFKGYEKMGTPQLWAIFYRIRQEYNETEPTVNQELAKGDT